MNNTLADHAWAFWKAAAIFRAGTQDAEVVEYLVKVAQWSDSPRFANAAEALLKRHGIEVMPALEEETDLTYAASEAAKGPEERAQAYWEAAQRRRDHLTSQ